MGFLNLLYTNIIFFYIYFFEEFRKKNYWFNSNKKIKNKNKK